MALSEVMTFLVLFQFSHYRTFKDFYLHCVSTQYGKDFPNLVSYNRLIEWMPQTFMPFLIFLLTLSGTKTGKYFIDSTKLSVCHNLRINRNKVFKDVAKRGKTSTGWFFGFKLHLLFNDQGELISFCLTTGNTDDRKGVEEMAKGIELITKVRKKMKENILSPLKEYYLNKRSMVETIIDQLKHLLNVDHSRHRSISNFQINILAGLTTYIFKPKKVSVPFHSLNLLPSPLI